MILVDIKTDVNQKEIQGLVVVSYNFHRSTFSKLEKIFSFNISWYSIQLDIDH